MYYEIYGEIVIAIEIVIEVISTLKNLFNKISKYIESEKETLI